MIRQLTALAGSMALGLLLAGGMVNLAISEAQGATDQNPPIRTEWIPCAMDEPSPFFNCVWDARHQGNGIGQSFFAAKGGRIWPVPHHIAHSLLNPENQRDYVACATPVTSDPVMCIWEESVWLNRSGDDHQIPRSVGRFLLYRYACSA